MKCCAAMGGVGCMLPAWGKGPSAKDSTAATNGNAGDGIDLNKLTYCGIRCDTQCELYKATKDNDVALKRKVYDSWKWKQKFGFEFDPEKVFCYTCKPGDRPMKIGIDKCGVRKCTMDNGMESCIECRNLQSCGQGFWKNWPGMHKQALQMQAQYLAQSKTGLMEAKKTSD
jgi:hypothetical protein